MNKHELTDKKPPLKEERVIVITQKDGIQGTPGKNGVTPHIDKKTGRWFIANVDTGVSATGLSKDDITLLQIFDTIKDFPTEGTPKDLYIALDTQTTYLWNTFSRSYGVFKPQYVIDIEFIISTMKADIQKNVLRKPSSIVNGGLLTLDANGEVKSTNVTYEELLDKINNVKCEGSLPANLVPGALLIGSNAGSIDSSDITQAELISVIKDSKKHVKFSEDKIISGSLIVATENGNIKSSGKTINQLIEDIQKYSVQSDWQERNETNPAFIKNKPDFVPLKDFVSLIDTVDKKPEFAGNVTPGSLIIADKYGKLRSTEIAYKDVLTAEDIVVGSKCGHTHILNDEQDNVAIPEIIRKYPSITVYHNGNLLLEGIHYTLGEKAIALIGFRAYKADIFGFVGYGSTTYKDPTIILPPDFEIPNITAGSKSVYVQITQDKTSTVIIPESVRNYSAITVYHNGILLAEGLHYYVDRTFILLNRFFAYENDVFNFVGYGSVATVDREPEQDNNSGILNLVGSVSKHVNIDNDGITTIAIPDNVRAYPAISVYHNGVLLVESVHYAMDTTKIKLISFVAYKNDVFNFVGYGSASLLPDEFSTNHSHQNKIVLDTISQEKIDAWDTITTHNHDDLYIKNEMIPPALLPKADKDTLGIVKSSEGLNKVTVMEDGTMCVKNIDISTLVSEEIESEDGEDFSIVLSSGSSFSYKY